MGTVNPGSGVAHARVRSDRASTAVRGGALLFAAMAVGNITNYGFTILAGRVLGPADYGVLSALLALVFLMSVLASALRVMSSTKLLYSEILRILTRRRVSSRCSSHC